MGFDEEAYHYDVTFSDRSVGQEQRAQVHQYLEMNKLDVDQHILELNCGTGIDANYFLNKRNSILATDQSEGMIKKVQERNTDIQCEVLSFQNVNSLHEKYSLVFSNFGGLNCLSPDEMKTFFSDVVDRLKTNGQLVLVIMGKRCAWDNFFLFLKGKWKEIGRRNTTKPLELVIQENTVSTWYYSPKEIRRMATDQLLFVDQKPIGLFVPPSYLAEFCDKYVFIFRFMKFMDRFFRWKIFSNYGDHYLIHFSKKDT